MQTVAFSSQRALDAQLAEWGCDQARGAVLRGGTVLATLAEKVAEADAAELVRIIIEAGGQVVTDASRGGRLCFAASAAEMLRVLRGAETSDRLALQGIAAAVRGAVHRGDLRRQSVSTVRGYEFRWGKRTYVMGIVNATPDSFSGDGLLSKPDGVSDALERARQFLSAGADIIDVGGESTRPGAAPVDKDVELARVLPVVTGVRERSPAPISIDTSKASVAAAALDAGADMVNDVWGLAMDPDMAGLVAERGCPLIIMHNRSRPRNAVQEQRLGGRYVGVEYGDLMVDILLELDAQVATALAAGIQPGQIIVDPGIGFGKTVAQNLSLIKHSEDLGLLGFPVLQGPSRKSFIGYTLDLPPGDRAEGTAAAVAYPCALGGADIVRVHDVGMVSRVTRMIDAIREAD